MRFGELVILTALHDETGEQEANAFVSAAVVVVVVVMAGSERERVEAGGEGE